MLNTQSPIPLYHQLAEILQGKIASGEYASGERIPSETKLVEIYGIGRPTVRQAIDTLVRRRLLIRKRGSGTYVNQPEEAVDLFSLAGTISSFLEKGISVDSRIVCGTGLVPVKTQPGNPFSGDQAYFYSRLSLVEKEPVLLEEMYLHHKLFSGLDRIDMEGRSLSRLVESNYFMVPTGGRQNFRIITLAEKKAQLLNVTSDTPILEVERLIHFPAAKNAIYAKLYCRTDRFVFSQVIGGYPNE